MSQPEKLFPAKSASWQVRCARRGWGARIPARGAGILLPPMLCVLAALSGCSGSSSNQAPMVVVAYNLAPPSSIFSGTTVVVSATVANDPANAGVTWSVSCGSTSCGSFAPVQTLSGITTVYTAPGLPPIGGTVNLTAVSVTDRTATATVTATITSSVAVTFTQAPPSTLAAGAQATIIASVANDPTNQGVDWKVTCGGSNCGNFSLTHTMSGLSTTYTAPNPPPPGGTVTITATSTADPTKSVIAIVKIGSTSGVGIALSQAPPSSLPTGGSASVGATVTNDPLNLGVDWSLSCTGGACGSISPLHTASGATTTFTAPANIPPNNTVTITAAATADPTVTITATVTITLPTAITITLTQAPPLTLPPGGQATVAATVTNDPTKAGVDWTVTCGSSNCGSFSPTHTNSGATTIYTAPSTAPTGGTVTLKATATADSTKNVSATVTISAVSLVGLLNGPYVFTFAGTDSTGPYGAVGTITADGAGNITGGEEDFADVSNFPTTTSLSGTYTIGSDGRGTMSLTTSQTFIGVNGIQTLSFAVVSFNRALITEFDTSATSIGTLDAQTSTDLTLSAFSGGYAFRFSGSDLGTTPPTPTAIGGVLTADGKGNITSGVEDVNDGGVVTNPAISGTYATPDSFGRGTATIGAATYVYYIADSGNIKFLETDNILTSGSAFTQGTSTFSSGSLTGNYAFTLLGASVPPGTALSDGGIFTADGKGNLSSGTLDANSGGILVTSAITGTYTVASNGRGTMSPAGVTQGPKSLALYFTSTQGILLLDLDTDAVSAGIVMAQGSGLSAASFSGNYATNWSGSSPKGEVDAVGLLTANGISALTGTGDLNMAGGILSPNTPLAGTFIANSNGRFTGTITENSTVTLPEIFYLLNASTVLLLETDTTPSTGLLQFQSLIGPPVSIAFTLPPPASLPTGGQAQISATVTNDIFNQGVDWSVTCGSSSCGSFNPTHTTSGATTTYTAPLTIPTGGTVAITATATADPTKSVTATVTIKSSTSVSISFSPPPPATLQVSAQAMVGATVTNDPMNLGVDWTVTCGSSSCGSFNPTHTSSGALTTYTAPSTVPTGGTVTITATATADHTAFVTATVTITPAIISVTFLVPPPVTLPATQMAMMSATVINDPQNLGVDWSVTCGDSNCGFFNPSHTQSGVETTYTAPPTIPTGGTVTITATSTADPTKSVSATVTITNPPITIQFVVPPPASLQTNATALMSASVQNDSQNLGVDWSVTCGSSNCGSFNPSHTQSGVETTYTAPPTVPTGGTVTITAASTADPTKTVSAMVTITSSGMTQLLTGPYAFTFSGTDGNGFYTAGGGLISDGNGNITAGEEDFQDFNTLPLLTMITGTYAIGADGRGTMSLKTTFSNIGVNGTQTLTLVVVSPNHVLITEADTDATSSGTMDLQTTSAFTLSAITGGYSFDFSGIDLFNAGTHVGGVITADGNGNFTSGTQDLNEGGVVSSSSINGTYKGPVDSFGRLTATIGTSTYSIYIVDGTNLKFFETDLTNFITIGPAYAQGSGSFTDGSLSGTYAFTTAGTSKQGAIVAGGLFTASGSGTLSAGAIDVNNAGTQTTDSPFTGTYTVASNGRGTLTFTGTTGGVSKFASYFTASHGVLLLEIDTGTGTSGSALAQASGISAGTLMGNYALGFNSMKKKAENDWTGQAIADGISGFTGTVDINQNMIVSSGLPLTGTFAGNTLGRFVGSLTTSVTGTLPQVFYVVDSSTVLYIETDASQGAGVLELQQF